MRPEQRATNRILAALRETRDQDACRQSLRFWDLTFADNAPHALELLANADPSFDLAILDDHPEIGGEQTLSTIRRELDIDIPVLIATRREAENTEDSLLRFGDHDFIDEDDLATPRVVTAVVRALKRYRLVKARQAAETELRVKNQDLEKAFRSLRETQAHLVQHEKMVSLGQLAAGMAHEINNPLAFVSNNLVVLERDVRLVAEAARACLEQLGDDLPESIRQFADQVDLNYTIANLSRLIQSSRQGVARAQRIVGNFRDFVGLDEGELKSFDINEIVRSALAMVESQARAKGVKLEVDLRADTETEGSPGKLAQVIFNILVNAIQSIPPERSGEVRVTTCCEDMPDCRHVLIVIADNGPGIPDDIRAKIFDPFFTTKPPGVGTGLGLWICYNIVNEHQGQLDVESRTGAGATFTIRLPTRLDRFCPLPSSSPKSGASSDVRNA